MTAPQANGPLIKLQGVTKVFLTEEVETHALSGIELDIKEGEFVAIAGPSGCGKTTLLSILGLLDTPSNGEYYLATQPVAQLTPSQRAAVRNRQIGFIFQAFNLIGDLTVYENVELPLLLPGIKVNTSPTDFAPIEQEQLARFNGEKWDLYGEIFDAYRKN